MFSQVQREAFQWNERIAVFVGSLLVAAMMACLGLSVQGFSTRLVPVWTGSVLPWICLGIALEAIFSEGRVRQYSIFSPNRIVYRISELILLTVGLKLLLSFLRDENIPKALAAWREDFPLGFFAGEFGSTWVLMIVVWALSGVWGNLLYDLVQDTELLRPGSEPQFFTSRKEIRRRLAGQIFFVGSVMVVLTVLTRVDLQALWGSLPPVETNALNILVYFFLAFVLLSQGQFAVLRASWIWQNIPVTRPMAMGWLRYSLIFLAVLALLVLLLPTGYSLSLLALLQILLGFLFSILYFLFYLLMLPIFWLLNFMARQRGEEELFQNPFNNIFEPPPPSESLPAIATLPISEVIKSFLFWGIFLLVCGYALVQYLRQNQELLERLRRIPGLRWIIEGVTSFLAWLRGASQTVGAMAAAGWERVRPKPRLGTSAAPWSLIRPNQLPPREQVWFYYLALVRRAGDNGLPRGVQTPQEYATTLRQVLPEQNQELSTLTEAFLEARYTQHAIPVETAHQVKTIWESLRGLFRKGK